MPSPTPTCYSTEGIARCTPQGELGAWDGAVLTPDGRHLTIYFTGFCGAPHGYYRPIAAENSKVVSIAVYGNRPYSNLCAGPQQAEVVLRAPLGRRALLDAYDGHLRHARHA